jgi:alpha/beta hydrolase fold
MDSHTADRSDPRSARVRAVARRAAQLACIACSAVAVFLAGVPSSSTVSVAGSAVSPQPAAKKRCRTVVKKVKGKKKRVRVCRRVKPKPKPAPSTSPAPSPTQLIDVGGYRLAIECYGEGQPTVILDAQHGGDRRTDWSLIQPDVSKTTRVCAYDRAGLGRSEPRPGRRGTTAQIVEELHALLERAGIAGPYVLAGNSIGGMNVRYFALRYPQETVGVVTVDGTTEGAMLYAQVTEATSSRESIVFGSALEELASAAEDLGTKPLIVLVHGIVPGDGTPEFEEVWQRTQRDVARRSSNSILARADVSDHDIWHDQPAIVIEALREVVAAVRSGTALSPCAQSPLPSLQATCLEK